MKEAHIICLAPRYEITDLGLKLKKGELIVRDQLTADASGDLKHAKKIGAVSVRYVQKAQEIRPRQVGTPAPTPLPRQFSPPRDAPVPSPAPPTVTPSLDVEALVTRMKDGLKEELAAGIREELAKIIKPSDKQPEDDKGKTKSKGAGK